MRSTTIIMGRPTRMRGHLTITRDTRPAPRAIHGIIITLGMATRTTTRLITTISDHRFRPRRRIGIHTSPHAPIRTTPVQRPAGTAVRSLDHCLSDCAGGPSASSGAYCGVDPDIRALDPDGGLVCTARRWGICLGDG